MLLEQKGHDESSFVTLTYADEDLPTVFNPETEEWIPTLVKSHPQKWIRSVRKKGYDVRYFFTGEYGSKTLRPHYHAIIFGLGHGAIDIFQDSWQRGYVSAFEANAKTMAYVAKYCLKGSEDPEPVPETFKPRGKDSTIPEDERLTTAPFRLFSRNPPIGGAFARNIARSLSTRHGNHVLHDPSVHVEKLIRTEGDTYPLDRTMRLRIRKEMGLNEHHANALWRSAANDATYEQDQAAKIQHRKAIRNRGKRNKL